MSAPDPRLAEVLRLALVEGQSVRAISRGLSMSRRTVRRLLGRAADLRRRAAAPKRTSLLDRFEPELKRLLADTPEMRAPAVLERLRPLGYAGGITILRDHLRGLRPQKSREAFLTLDFQPGAAVQVDWADFGFALPGCPRRVSAFVMALCYSRYLYVEFTSANRSQPSCAAWKTACASTAAAPSSISSII
jgi:transposase